MKSDYWYWDTGRVISLLVVVFNISSLFLRFSSSFNPFFFFLIQFSALAYIWFGDILGKWIPGHTPPPIVRLGGWVLLLSPEIFWIVGYFSNK